MIPHYTTTRIVLSSILLAACLPIGAAESPVIAEATALIQSLQTHFDHRQVDKITELFHPQYEEGELLKENLQKAKELDAFPDYTLTLLDAIEQAAAVVARVAIIERSADQGAHQRTELFVLKHHGGQLKILGTYEVPDAEAFDPETGLYSSSKGKYSVTAPAGWRALEGSHILRALTADSMILLAPDLHSKVMIGVLQLPLKLGDSNAETAQKAALADSAMESRLTRNHRVHDEGPFASSGMEGYRILSEFEGKEPGIGKRKRLRVYLVDDPILYFFVCDAIGPDQYGRLSSRFNDIITSLALLPIEGGLTRQEALAAEQAEGSVTGRVYTSEKYNCFIAAPEGWEIRTSPNPGHLVEMQYGAGKSIARLIGSKGIPKSASVMDIFSTRLDQVKSVVQEFVETSRREITLQNTPAIESVQSFQVDGLGHFQVHEWTVIKDNTYYLILCQCIEPDDPDRLAIDFELIMKSFGFIQD